MFYIRPRSSFPNTGELLNLYKKSRGKSSQILVYIFSCCYDKTQKIIFIFSQEEDWVMHVGHKSFLAKIKPSPPTAFQVCAPTRPQTTSDHYELGEKRKTFVSLDIWLGQMHWYFVYHFRGYLLQQRISGSELPESYI